MAKVTFVRGKDYIKKEDLGPAEQARLTAAGVEGGELLLSMAGIAKMLMLTKRSEVKPEGWPRIERFQRRMRARAEAMKAATGRRPSMEEVLSPTIERLRATVKAGTDVMTALEQVVFTEEKSS